MLSLTNIYYSDDDYTYIYNTTNPKLLAKKIQNVYIYNNIYTDIFIELTHKSKYLCKIFELYKINDIHYLIMEKLYGNDIFDYILNCHITEKNILKIIRQILKGLIYLNSNGFIHCDIKPENIILFNKNIKIIDYDFIEKIDSDKKNFKGTIGYIAPEILDNNIDLCYSIYNETIDIWSLGMTLYYIITKNSYYDLRINMNDYIHKINKFNIYTLLLDISNYKFRILLFNMLSKNRLCAEKFYEKFKYLF